MEKYYVIWKGAKTGIFQTWDECKEYILGFKGIKSSHSHREF